MKRLYKFANGRPPKDVRQRTDSSIWRAGVDRNFHCIFFCPSAPPLGEVSRDGLWVGQLRLLFVWAKLARAFYHSLETTPNWDTLLTIFRVAATVKRHITKHFFRGYQLA